jgi:hypothetical protein
VHVGSSASCCSFGRWLIGCSWTNLVVVVMVVGCLVCVWGPLCRVVVLVVVVVCEFAVVGQIYWNLCLVCMCETWREIRKLEVKVHCESSGAKIDPELSQQCFTSN